MAYDFHPQNKLDPSQSMRESFWSHVLIPFLFVSVYKSPPFFSFYYKWLFDAKVLKITSIVITEMLYKTFIYTWVIFTAYHGRSDEKV